MFLVNRKRFHNRTVIGVAVAMLFTCLVGCGSGSSSNSIPTPDTQVEMKPTTGIWAAPAYGVAVDITETSFSFYQYTSGYCQEYPIGELLDMDFDSFIGSSEVSSDATSLEATFAYIKIPGIVMQSQDALPQHCIDFLTKNIGDADYNFDPQTDLEIFSEVFSEQYAFFALENIDWNNIYEQAADSVTSNTTKEELFGVLAQMITPLQDFHVEIVSPELEAEYISPSRKPSFETIALIDFLAINELEFIPSEEVFFQFLDYLDLQVDSTLAVILSEIGEGNDLHINATETIYWARLQNNVGYLALTTMAHSEIGSSDSIDTNLQALEATMDQVLSDLGDTHGLIVDIRFNEGGNDFVSQYIAGRLTDLEINAYSKQARLGLDRTPLQNVVIEPIGDSQYTGPIALLTSMTSASAAETLALIMRERLNTALIGEATAGGFSDQITKILPSGIAYTLSNEIYVSPAGEEFEGVGVPVDITRPFFTLEQRQTGVDLGLQAAIDWLIGS